MGLPVIASAVQGRRNPRPTTNERALVPPRDQSGFAAAVYLLAQNPGLRKKLVENARKHVETHFSARRMAEEMAGVYSSFCS